jgi:hypothetical protein
MRLLKPYFKKSHKAWYVNIGPPHGRPVRLAARQRAKRPLGRNITRLWPPVKPDSTVAELIDRYLEHCHLNCAEWNVSQT